MYKLILAGLLFLGCICYDSFNVNTRIYPTSDWPAYGGNKEGNRYSALDQINIKNVKNLKVQWQYDASARTDSVNPGRRRDRDIQCQPIVLNGIMYGTTADICLFALNAATGEQLWKFIPFNDSRLNNNRGVAYWEKGKDKRILYTVGAHLYAVNAETGKVIPDFGQHGRVDLHEGLQTNMDHDVSKLSVAATSPGVVFKDIFIIGSTVSESGDAAPGHIRAFDVITGKLKWVFHTIPQPGEFGYDTWPKDAYKKIGATNNWSGLSLDEKRGVVYLGTGSPAVDFYGGGREGANLFANCILALDALTGKMKWYYQTIHHDLWDRDHPSPPNLTTITHNGRELDVVVQATKDGLVYVLDRDKGTSVFPVEERPVPTNGLPGEHPYPTQRYPVKPLPLTRQTFTAEDITDLSPEAHAYVKERWVKLTSDNKFAPPSTTGTLLFGYSGGAEWGGNAADPDGIFYQNVNEEPWELIMEDASLREVSNNTSLGQRIYSLNCAVCHGKDKKGSGQEFPSLISIDQKMSEAAIRSILKSGSGRMPSFSHLPSADIETVTRFLLNKESGDKSSKSQSKSEDQPKETDFPYRPGYVSKTWQRFTDQNGYPGVKPPWGTLNAINLNTGEYVWKVPLGEYPELAKKGVPITGTVSYGGPLVTAGGLVFIAGTKDEKIRAFNKTTGELVWEYQLPAGGFATPVTYSIAGKQYVVIAAGGGRGQKYGGNYVAFALE